MRWARERLTLLLIDLKSSGDVSTRLYGMREHSKKTMDVWPVLSLKQWEPALLLWTKHGATGVIKA